MAEVNIDVAKESTGQQILSTVNNGAKESTSKQILTSVGNTAKESTSQEIKSLIQNSSGGGGWIDYSTVKVGVTNANSNSATTITGKGRFVFYNGSSSAVSINVKIDGASDYTKFERLNYGGTVELFFNRSITFFGNASDGRYYIQLV